jgi:hypothetical protein
MPVVVSGDRRLRQRIIRGGAALQQLAPCRAGLEKSPRRCRLGLNPPMKEVEETIGSVAFDARFASVAATD